MFRYAMTNGTAIRYDIADPHPSGWLFLHQITERPTVQGPDGKVPPMKTELIAAFPPNYPHSIDFVNEEESSVKV